MKRKKIFFSLSIFILLSTILNAESFRIEIFGNFFYPSEKAFRNIYGEGISFGVPDNEVDDFAYQLSRNNFEFRIS